MVSLSIRQKQELFKKQKNRVEQGRKVKQSDQCECPNNQLDLTNAHNQFTISRTIKDEINIGIDNIEQTSKSPKHADQPAVE